MSTDIKLCILRRLHEMTKSSRSKKRLRDEILIIAKDENSTTTGSNLRSSFIRDNCGLLSGGSNIGLNAVKTFQAHHIGSRGSMLSKSNDATAPCPAHLSATSYRLRKTS